MGFFSRPASAKPKASAPVAAVAPAPAPVAAVAPAPAPVEAAAPAPAPVEATAPAPAAVAPPEKATSILSDGTASGSVDEAAPETSGGKTASGATEESVGVPPEVSLPEAEAEPALSSDTDNTPKADVGTGEVAAVVEAVVEEAAEEAAGPELAPGWEVVPAEGGKVFYWHKETDTTSWEVPTPNSKLARSSDAAAEAAAPAEPPASSAKRVSAMFEARNTAAAVVPDSSSPARGGVFAKWQQRDEGTASKEVKVTDLSRVQISGSSQHAHAMRGLQAAAAAQPPPPTPPTQRSKAMMAFERKGLGDSASSVSPGAGSPASARHHQERGSSFMEFMEEGSSHSSASPSVDDGAPQSVSNAREKLFGAKEKEDEAAGIASRRREALRKLNAKGVVSTKQAYGVKSTQGSQHSAALAAFTTAGTRPTLFFF